MRIVFFKTGDEKTTLKQKKNCTGYVGQNWHREFQAVANIIVLIEKCIACHGTLLKACYWFSTIDQHYFEYILLLLL